jgi:hypothetical protein
MPKAERVSWMGAAQEEVSTNPSAGRDPWRELVDEIIPSGTRLVWDKSTGKLVVRMPKARWK